jgi:hypothetical protein
MEESKDMSTVMNSELTVSDIAHAIAKDWKNISPYAADYLNAMKDIKDIDSAYYSDSAKSVILYFLVNANTYRGENARAYKTLLKKMVK